MKDDLDGILADLRRHRADLQKLIDSAPPDETCAIQKITDLNKRMVEVAQKQPDK
jgi:hypothetical protein